MLPPLHDAHRDVEPCERGARETCLPNLICAVCGYVLTVLNRNWGGVLLWRYVALIPASRIRGLED